MTLDETKSLVHHAVKKDQILGVFPTLINQALKQIQRQRSFRFMKKVIDVTIPAGSTSIALPATYKEPQRGKNPLRASDINSLGYVNWVLLSKQEVERLFQIGVNTSERRAYIDHDGTTDVLYIPGAASSNILFKLDSYSFLPLLSAGTDTNLFLGEYPQMVLEKTKELAFRTDMQDGDADAAEYCRGRYIDEFRRAEQDDSSREVAGRSFRMGGE